MIPNSIAKLGALISENDVNIPHSSLGGDTIQHGLQLFFQIASAVAMLIIAIGAFKYVISRGDANSIKNAKETIIYAAVGLMITLTGYGIVTFVIKSL